MRLASGVTRSARCVHLRARRRTSAGCSRSGWPASAATACSRSALASLFFFYAAERRDARRVAGGVRGPAAAVHAWSGPSSGSCSTAGAAGRCCWSANAARARRGRRRRRWRAGDAAGRPLYAAVLACCRVEPVPAGRAVGRPAARRRRRRPGDGQRADADRRARRRTPWGPGSPCALRWFGAPDAGPALASAACSGWPPPSPCGCGACWALGPDRVVPLVAGVAQRRRRAGRGPCGTCARRRRPRRAGGDRRSPVRLRRDHASPRSCSAATPWPTRRTPTRGARPAQPGRRGSAAPASWPRRSSRRSPRPG